MKKKADDAEVFDPGTFETDPKLDGPGNESAPSSGAFKMCKDEIAMLLAENRTLKGKVKGYQMLGHLLQESKQECVKYRRMNEELKSKLESITDSHKDDSQMVDVSHEDTNPKLLYAGNSDIGNLRGHVYPNLEWQKTGVDISLDQSDAIAEDSAEGSKSFVNSEKKADINGSNRESALFRRFEFVETDGLSNSEKHSSSSSKDFNQSKKTDEGNAAASLSKIILTESGFDHAEKTEHIKRLVEQLGMQLEAGGKSSSHALPTQLAQMSIEVFELQKQLHVSKTFVESLTAENEVLKSKVKSLENETVQGLRTENERLLAKIKSIEGGDKIGHADSLLVDWVNVENKQTETKQEPEPAAISKKYSNEHLQRKIEQLKEHNLQLASANQRWDEHCMRMKADHEQQIKYQTDQIKMLQDQMNSMDSKNGLRQRDVDLIVVDMKKKLESEEMAKEDALSQLHVERQHGASLRKQLEQEKKRCRDMYTRVGALETQAIELIDKKRDLEREKVQLQMAEPSRRGLNIAPDVNQVASLKTQLQVLQTQVTIYKDDFDNERKDRERLQSNNALLMSQLDALRTDATVASRKIRQLDEELKKERQMRQVTQAETEAIKDKLLTQPRPKTNGWPCKHCTYENVIERSTCEMCGARKGSVTPEMNIYGGATGGQQDVTPKRSVLYDPAIMGYTVPH